MTKPNIQLDPHIQLDPQDAFLVFRADGTTEIYLPISPDEEPALPVSVAVTLCLTMLQDDELRSLTTLRAATIMTESRRANLQ